MNPEWNHQPYNYNQHTPGPPPPPWQADPNARTGWGDPRLQNFQQPHINSPLSPLSPIPFSNPPPPPPPPPIQYPPPPGAGPSHAPPPQPYNVSQWGVRYNQVLNQNLSPQVQAPYEEQRPTLPPRPNSALAQNAQAPPPAYEWQRPATPQYPTPDPWCLPPAHGPSDNPPILPPRPSAYMMQTQQPQESIPHPQYSHQPLTHHYDPQTANYNWHQTASHQQYPPPITTQPHTPSNPEWSQTVPATDGPISPLEGGTRQNSYGGRSQTVSPVPHQNHQASGPAISSNMATSRSSVQVGATALGPGRPSDWQHYHVSDSYDDDDEVTSELTPPANRDQPQQFSASPDLIHKEPARNHTEQIRPPQGNSIPMRSRSNAQAESQNVEAEYARAHSQSPSITSAYGQQLHSKRSGSVSTTSSVSGVQRAGTIDSVIHAWTAPLKRKPTAQDQALHHSGSTSSVRSNTVDRTVISKPITTDSESQTDFPPIVTIETRVETREVEVDPYEDIQEHYKATLKRFADMLRQEVRAESDEDKFKIFQGFVIHELRLRGVLYGIEAQHTSSPPRPTAPVKSPVNEGNEDRLDARSLNPVKDDLPSQETRPRTPPAKLSLSPRGNTTPASYKDDSFVVIDAGDGDYSPGGRPRMSHISVPPRLDIPTLPQTSVPKVQNATPHIASMPSPGANAPMTLEDYMMPDQKSPSDDAPMVVSSEDMSHTHHSLPFLSATLTGPINFQPPRPVYTPFRYNESVSQSPPSTKVNQAAEDYAVLRQVQAAESGRMLTNDVPLSSAETSVRNHSAQASLGRREHEEAFIGLIRQQSKAIRRPPSALDNPLQLRAGTPMKRNVQTPVNVPPLTKSVQSLQSCIPKTAAATSDSSNPKLDSIKRSLAATRDEFGFIHAAVLAWDTTNRNIRQQLEMERAARQSENESRVDILFHENEIGYADIASLESDFKLNEAGNKYQEDKLELESFSKDVFEVVVDRMESELAELSKLQVLSRDLLDLNSQSKGMRMQSYIEGKGGTAHEVLMADVMDVMLQIFNKVELRYLKIAEAHFELERRRKKLELSVLYTNGDTSGVKALEKDFSKAQVMQVLEEARKKDERANRLIDSFDRAVVRGLAENQAWIDDFTPKLQLLRDLLFGSEENHPEEQSDRDNLIYGEAGITDLIVHAQSAVNTLMNDSQQLVKLSYSADQILNEADFSMYVANEKILDPDPERSEKLKRDKKQEDEKIAEEYEARLSVVRRDPEEALVLLREILGRTGNDKEHKARIERALDEAKKRNNDDEAKA